jgi:hypothetical protein
MISSTEAALERLRNWYKAGTELMLTSVSVTDRKLFEVRVRIAAVDSSTVILSKIDAPGQTETLDLRGAAFAEADLDTPNLHVTFADGKNTILRADT